MAGIIDAVITWVDGYDRIHQHKLASHLTALGIERPETAAPTRFNQCGEINYCVKSILRFAPWIRTIYIVTDTQTPPIVQQLAGTPHEGRIKLVDHRDIFLGFEHCLPTFNSVTIESMLWKIKGLSEQFIYFNDDVALMRPVQSNHFFQGDQVVLRGKWKITSNSRAYTFYNHILKTIGQPKALNLHRQVQENSAALAGIKNWFFHLPHVPFPIKKSTLEQFFSNHPEVLSNNIKHPFRAKDQFLPVSLAHHLEIQHKTAVIENSIRAVGVDASRHSLKEIKSKLNHAEKDNRVAFVCMQGLDMAPTLTQHFMLESLNKWIK